MPNAQQSYPQTEVSQNANDTITINRIFLHFNNSNIIFLKLNFLFLIININRPSFGATEKAGVEKAGALKMQGWKTREWKTRHHNAGVENAGVENTAPQFLCMKTSSGKVVATSFPYPRSRLGGATGKSCLFCSDYFIRFLHLYSCLLANFYTTSLSLSC